MANPNTETETSETFFEAILGKGVRDVEPVKRFLSLPADWRVAMAAAAFAGLLFIPYLGAVGLWDPWETHYGEVAREMIQRNDYVHPYWENAWFFSKPVFTMWLQALGMQLVGTLRTEGALGLYTEWGFRLPFALFSILAVTLLSYAVSRVVSRRAGLATGFVLATMPLYFLISRQAVTDTPMLSAMICALACALVGHLDKKSQHRAAWWYGFYVFCGFGTLAKGILGVGVPAVILLSYAVLCVIPWDLQSLEDHARWLFDGKFHREVNEGKRPMPVLWAQLYEMRLLTGVGVWALITLPWYVRMFLFESVDDEGKLFWYRFLIHDHLSRLGAGVHTTTPGGSFTYFIEQGGYAIFPWVALLPGAMVVVTRLRLRSKDGADHLGVIAVLWLAITFGLIGASATKFHHYVLPMLPPLAVLMGLFIDRLWSEGVSKHGVSLLFGVPLFALVGKDLASNTKNFTDLFVYNYDRPYPFDLVQRSLALFNGRALWMGDLLAVVLLGLGGYLIFETFANKSRSSLSRAGALFLTLTGAAVLLTVATRGAVSPTLFVGLGLALVALFLAYEAMRPVCETKYFLYTLAAGVGVAAMGFVGAGVTSNAAQDPLLALLTEAVNTKRALGFAFAAAGVLAATAALMRAKVVLFGSFWAFACAFALWFNWSHWVDLSHHWTQRDQFWRYYEQRKEGEPITAFLMNWRGETFYSRNTVKQIKDNGRLFEYANQPGREWALVEHNRLGILKQAVGPDKTVNLVERELNNKFVLVTID